MLRIGLTGLLTFQQSLATTSHNISNANTPGYSRQRTELDAIDGQRFGNGFFGRGVGVSGVTQIANRFADIQLREATTDAGRAETYEELTQRLDNLLAAQNSGLAPSLTGLFDSLQAMSADPTSTAARELVLNSADSLIGRFQFLDSEIDRLYGEANDKLRVMVADVNALAEDIASLNDDIVVAIGLSGGEPPNDLLDQRRERIKQLAELVSVQTLEQENGAINIFVGNGQPLVVDTDARPLTTVSDPLDPTLLQVGRDNGGGTVAVLSNQITGGELGGLLDFRRDVLPGVRNELGRVATVMADAVNAQHRRGMDVDGNLGGDFFVVPSPATFADSFNTGAASITATITDYAQLEASDYRLDYDGANFTMTRLTDGAAITAAAGPLVMDGISVAIAGAAAAGDTFLVRAVGRGAELIAMQISDPDRIAAAGAVAGAASLSNLGDAQIDQPETLDPGNAALLADIDIVFNEPPTSFDIVDVATSTVLSAAVPYVANATIAVNGWSTSISGDPVGGDSFRIEANTGGVGDNRNALAMVSLQTATLLDGRSTLQEGYSTLVARVGIVARQAGFNADAQVRLREDAQDRRDRISGVNLDEEAVDLTRYQRAYQAMAQTIDTSNQIFNTLIAAIQ
jgi:flagellar hook-associated protein 1 FlgK